MAPDELVIAGSRWRPLIGSLLCFAFGAFLIGMSGLSNVDLFMLAVLAVVFGGCVFLLRIAVRPAHGRRV